MLKRLLVGLLTGLVVGSGIGAGLHFGLGWSRTAGLLAYLVSMGACATAGIVAGRPPWREGAWIEALLKGIGGLLVGAGSYFVAARWGAVSLPVRLPGVDVDVPWTELPLLYAPALAALYAALVELDNSGDGAKKPQNQRKAAATGRAVEVIEPEEAFDETPVPRGRRAPPARGRR
jgi:hypothetical protein